MGCWSAPQISISLVLLITTGLFIRSSLIAATIDPGFDPQNGLVLTLDLGLQDYTETRGKQFQQELKERLAALPGVKAVSLASYVPLGPDDTLAEVRIEGREPAPESDQDLVGSIAVDSDYFQTMGTGLLRGRNFGSADREASPKVVIINETMAKRYWPGVDAIGKRLRLGAADAPLREVVAIVKDGKWRYLSEPPRAVVYRPISQSWSPLSSFVVRTAGQPNSVLADVRREVQRLDPNLPVQALRTLPEHVGEALWPSRLGRRFAVGLRFTCADAGCSGAVRIDCLPGQSTDARDWHSPGAWGSGWRRAQARDLARPEIDVEWFGHRPARSFRADSFDGEPVIWPEPDRSADISGDHFVTCRGRCARELHPGAARNKGRSVSGTQVRVK